MTVVELILRIGFRKITQILVDRLAVDVLQTELVFQKRSDRFGRKGMFLIAVSAQDLQQRQDPQTVLQGVVVQPRDGGHVLSEELAVKSRYEQVSLALFKTIDQTGFYVALFVAGAIPSPSDIKRVFLFAGEPKSLSGIADLKYIGGNLNKVEVLARIPIIYATNVGGMCQELLKANPNDHFDLWKVVKMVKPV